MTDVTTLQPSTAVFVHGTTVTQNSFNRPTLNAKSHRPVIGELCIR